MIFVQLLLKLEEYINKATRPSIYPTQLKWQSSLQWSSGCESLVQGDGHWSTHYNSRPWEQNGVANWRDLYCRLVIFCMSSVELLSALKQSFSVLCKSLKPPFLSLYFASMVWDVLASESQILKKWGKKSSKDLKQDLRDESDPSTVHWSLKKWPQWKDDYPEDVLKEGKQEKTWGMPCHTGTKLKNQ